MIRYVDGMVARMVIDGASETIQQSAPKRRNNNSIEGQGSLDVFLGEWANSISITLFHNISLPPFNNQPTKQTETMFSDK